MKRIVAAYIPDGSPVEILKLVCMYQARKDSTTFAAGKKEGVYALVDFSVRLDNMIPSDIEENSESRNPGSSRKPSPTGGIEAAEFIFVLYDIFDKFMISVPGFAGPGKYLASRKKHRARWVFEVDGAFSQYHALCFPSQARLLDGTVWRCDRDECINWLNEQMSEAGAKVTAEDVFMDGGMREGASE